MKLVAGWQNEERHGLQQERDHRQRAVVSEVWDSRLRGPVCRVKLHYTYTGQKGALGINAGFPEISERPIVGIKRFVKYSIPKTYKEWTVLSMESTASNMG